MIKDKYIDLIYDKRRKIIEWILIIQLPFIFLLGSYLFQISLTMTWLMKLTMAFWLYCILIKRKTFLYSIKIVDKNILNEFNTETIQRDNLTSWSRYKNYERKISTYSIFLLLVCIVLTRIFLFDYYRDIFLILFYIEGGLFFLINLDNIRRYTEGLKSFFAKQSVFKNITNSKNLFGKIREPLSYKQMVGESLILTLLYLLILFFIFKMGTFQYIQYSIAVFILYATTRLFIQMRRYFYSVLEFVDTIREEET